MSINQMQISVFHPMDYKARQREMMGVWDLQYVSLPHVTSCYESGHSPSHHNMPSSQLSCYRA